jgi:hypothetical protein
MRATIRWHCRQFAAAINFFALSKTLPPAESCATVQFEDRTPPSAHATAVGFCHSQREALTSTPQISGNFSRWIPENPLNT